MLFPITLTMNILWHLLFTIILPGRPLATLWPLTELHLWPIYGARPLPWRREAIISSPPGSETGQRIRSPICPLYNTR
jgi:hypothetical protein